MTMENWAKVIWSDECYVYIGDINSSIHVTRRSSEVLHEDCLVPTFKQLNLRVMVWGCIIRGHLGPLVVLEYSSGKEDGMNSKRYQEQVLEAYLEHFYKAITQERGSVKFQQDNAASHVSKTTKQWLKSHSISLFNHPASLPDLSAIEPVWHKLKTIIQNHAHLPTSLEKLKQAVYEAWECISIETVNKQVDRMPSRVAAVLAARGGHTGF
jgi:hypothetical protein